MPRVPFWVNSVFWNKIEEIFTGSQIQGNVSKPRRLYLGRKPGTVRTGKVTAIVARVSKRSQSLSVASSDGSDQPALPGALPPD